MAISCLPLLLFALLFWSHFLNQSPAVVEGSGLRVLNFNILYSNHDYAAIALLIKSQRPDLVALQEVQPEAMRYLVEQLAEDFPHYAQATYNPYGTTAIFSRLPVSNTYILDLEADRSAVAMRVLDGERSITFISAHLRAFGWPTINYLWENDSLSAALFAARQFRVEQNRQAEILVQALSGNGDDAAILACDCNSKAFMSTYALLNKELKSATQAVGWQAWRAIPANAYPELNPQNVEYTFYGGALSPTTAYKLRQNAGSDHDPLFSEFVWGIAE